MSTDRELFESTQSFQDRLFEKLDLSDVMLAGKEFSKCVFRGVKLLDSAWRRVTFEDCVFERCDLSNLRFNGSTLAGVDFKESKLVGAAWADLGPSPMVSFTDCAMRYQSFASINLRGTKFTRCSIVDATFIDVDLSKSTFNQCELEKTLFERCNLMAADFSGASGLFFDAAKNRAKGARISAETAVLIASAQGLVVDGYD